MDRPLATSPARYRLLVRLGMLGLLLLFVGLPLAPWRGESPSAAQDEPAEGASPAVEKVILLTGFEPFGPQRPDNPSWEGVKQLDGRTLHGYRVAARQLPVIWGAPQRELKPWIEQLRPAAVFSFGQGGPGGFFLETVASNTRGGYPDNSGQLPPTDAIVAGGAAEFHASYDCPTLAQQLSQRGFPTQISTSAGRYLCEETLYTLEHLRQTQYPQTSVLFCHVPPLGSDVQGAAVDADYVQRFVLAVLESWATSAAETSPVEPAEDPSSAAGQNSAAGNSRPKIGRAVLPRSDGGVAIALFENDPAANESDSRPAAEDPRTAEVEELIRRYFSTWSNQDINGYGACFAPGAIVQFIDPRQQIRPYTLERFLASQREAHRAARHPLRETPESIDIRFEAGLARAVVYWKLVRDRTIEEFGYDHFTLMKTGDKWRIVNLVFYSVDRAP